MDRIALDWLFSTASQAIAALVGLIFMGVTFFTDSLDKEVLRDDTKGDICDEMKKDIHIKMQWIYWLAGVSILLDLVILVLNPIEKDKTFSINGSFDWYLLVGGMMLLLNLVTIGFSLWFIVQIANPNYFKKTAKHMLGVIHGDTVSSKDFIEAFIEMEKALRELPLYVVQEAQKTQRRASVSDMLRELKYKEWVSRQAIADLYRLNRLRNAIVHGEDVESIENSDLKKVNEYTAILKELRKNL